MNGEFHFSPVDSSSVPAETPGERESLETQIRTSPEDQISGAGGIATAEPSNRKSGPEAAESTRPPSDRENRALEAVLGGLDVPFLVVDSSGCISGFSRAAGQLLEIGAEDAGKPLSTVSRRLGLSQLENCVRRVQDTLVPERLEIQIGHDHWIDVSVGPYCGTDEEPTGNVVLVFLDISPLKQKLRLANEARESAEAVFEVFQQPLVVLDSDLRVVRANAAYFELFRVSLDEITGKQFWTLGTGQWNRPRLRERLSAALLGKDGARDYELEDYFPYVGVCRLRVTACRLSTGTAGQRSALLVQIQDVTARQKGSYIHLRGFLEDAEDGIVVIDLDRHVISDVNSKFLELTGYSRGDLIGAGLEDCLPFRHLNGSLGVILNGEASDPVPVQTIYVRGRDGDLIEVGVLRTRYTAGTRHSLELRLLDTTERQRSEAALFDAMIHGENPPYAVIEFSPEFRVVSWSKEAESLFGWNAAEILGRKADELLWIHPNDLELTGRVWQELVNGQQPRNLTINRNYRKDGELLDCEWHNWAVYDSDGKMTSVVSRVLNVTKRQRAARALGESLKQFQDVIDGAPGLVYIKDLEGRFVMINRTFEKLLDRSRAEIRGTTDFDIFPYERAQLYQSHDLRVAVSGIPERVEEVMDFAGAGTRTYLAERFPLHRIDGRIYGICGILVDITRRKTAEEELRRHQELLRTTLGGIADGVIATDIAGRITFLNNSAAVMTGWTVADALGQPLSDVVQIMSRRTGEWNSDIVSRALQSGHAIAVGDDCVLVAVDRQMRVIQAFAVPLTGMSGSERGEISGVVLTFRNMTEQERIGEQLRRRVEESETLLADIPAFIWVAHDPECRTVIANTAAQTIAGAVAESQRPGGDGGTLQIQSNPDGRVLQSHELTMMRAMATGQPVRDVELDLWLTDGRRISALGSALPLFDSEAGVRGCIAAFFDITERKRIEEERLEFLANERALATEKLLREAESQLARAARALSVGELATSIAHEVNQPLAAVITNAEAGLRWLKAGHPNLERVEKSLLLIVRDGNRASDVIRNIRGFVKQQSQEMTAVDINEVIGAAVALLRGDFQKNRIEMHTQLAQRLPSISGRPSELQQVILNLLVNAKEAMATVQENRCVVVRTAKSDSGGVLVTVQDSGIGVKAGDLRRIFDAFFTTKNTGMGLGLSICRSIIEAHRGNIWADPGIEAGLAVSFHIPADSGEDV